MNLYVVFYTLQNLPATDIFTMPLFLHKYSLIALVKSDFMSNICPIYNKSMPVKGMIAISDYIMNW